MRTALVLWGALYVLFALRVAVTPTRLGVYPIFAEAARRWWQGMTMYPSPDGWSVFRYSPTFAIGFLPFGLLPDELGVLLWNLLSVGILFAALRTLVDRVFPWTWSLRQEGIFLALTVLGAARGIWSAQSNALLLALAIFGVAELLGQRWWRAAFFLAGAVAIKFWPVALVLLLLIRWWKPLLPRFVVALLALASVPFLLASPSWVLSEYQALGRLIRLTSSWRWPGMRDAWTIWEQFGSPDFASFMGLRVLTGALLFVWCVWHLKRLRSDRMLAASTLAGWAAWQLLFGPGTERLTYGLLAPFASAAILLSSEAGRRFRILSVGAWILTFVLGAGAAERALLPLFSFSPAIQPIGVVVYALWLALWLGSQKGEMPTSGHPPPEHAISRSP